MVVWIVVAVFVKRITAGRVDGVRSREGEEEVGQWVSGGGAVDEREGKERKGRGGTGETPPYRGRDECIPGKRFTPEEYVLGEADVYLGRGGGG